MTNQQAGSALFKALEDVQDHIDAQVAFDLQSAALYVCRGYMEPGRLHYNKCRDSIPEGSDLRKVCEKVFGY